jgi:hypothetical protein
VCDATERFAKRSKNADLRTREHLTPSEVDQLIEAARATMVTATPP